MAVGPLAVERLTGVDEALAEQLDALFDAGVAWDAEQGGRFLADPDNLFLVARWEGRVGGFATAHRLQRFDRRRAEVLLYEIGVDEAFRRRGLARALIAGVKRWAAEVGADGVWVLTAADNAPAKALYAATGGHEDVPGAVMFTYRIAPRGGEG